MQSVIVLFAMSLLVFVGVYAIGNPIDILINPQADQIDRERAIAALGLDKPLWDQYLAFWKRVAVSGRKRSPLPQVVLRPSSSQSISPRTRWLRRGSGFFLLRACSDGKHEY